MTNENGSSAEDSPPSPATSPKKGRGRPRKTEGIEDSGPAVGDSSENTDTKKGRGRPPKPTKDTNEPDTTGAGDGEPKRGRGRPRKHKRDESQSDGEEAPVKAPGKRGRPAKGKKQNGVDASGNPKKGRGRPKKVQEVEEIEGEDE